MQALRECFETKNVPMLQTALNSLSKEERAYHWQRCIASGLWVADAEAAGESLFCLFVCFVIFKAVVCI